MAVSGQLKAAQTEGYLELLSASLDGCSFSLGLSPGACAREAWWIQCQAILKFSREICKLKRNRCKKSGKKTIVRLLPHLLKKSYLLEESRGILKFKCKFVAILQVLHICFQIVVLARVIVDHDQVSLTALGVTKVTEVLRSDDDNAVILAG